MSAVPSVNVISLPKMKISPAINLMPALVSTLYVGISLPAIDAPEMRGPASDYVEKLAAKGFNFFRIPIQASSYLSSQPFRDLVKEIVSTIYRVESTPVIDVYNDLRDDSLFTAYAQLQNIQSNTTWIGLHGCGMECGDMDVPSLFDIDIHVKRHTGSGHIKYSGSIKAQ